MAGYIGGTAVVSANGAERKKTYTITGATTSLTGLSYTVNQVHVFHNGVRLVDGTDFTATNGSSITLTSAAESGDEVVVISYAGYQVSDTVSASQGGTFAGDVTVTGSFTSQGIDDNATSTAMTLDSSGSVHVGGTSESGTAQVTLNPSGYIKARKNNVTGIFDRISTDGDIVQFRKDGSTVGSIAADGGFMSIGSGDVGLAFNSSVNTIHPNNQGTLAGSDGQVDLGYTNVRFKDLYLSGGVYLGGTGSANKLDDYEEGTWTISSPAATGFSISSIDAQECYYQKSGKWVSLYGFLRFTVPSSPQTVVSGDYVQFSASSLPFTPEILDGISVNSQLGTCHMYNSYGGSENCFGFMAWTSSNVYLYLGQSVTGSPQSNNPIYFVATYRTD